MAGIQERVAHSVALPLREDPATALTHALTDDQAPEALQPASPKLSSPHSLGHTSAQAGIRTLGESMHYIQPGRLAGASLPKSATLTTLQKLPQRLDLPQLKLTIETLRATLEQRTSEFPF
jgi:hypothetical protein